MTLQAAKIRRDVFLVFIFRFTEHFLSVISKNGRLSLYSQVANTKRAALAQKRRTIQCPVLPDFGFTIPPLQGSNIDEFRSTVYVEPVSLSRHSGLRCRGKGNIFSVETCLDETPQMQELRLVEAVEAVVELRHYAELTHDEEVDESKREELRLLHADFEETLPHSSKLRKPSPGKHIFPMQRASTSRSWRRIGQRKLCCLCNASIACR
ncbi:hypothetical protein AZE42_06091 [Rhizopogon vesiculosus]|uniref:Uncharacterized protein n=1 Tax=Rhizopogon vesiculosus TaxID=180088 RepID=A0A1J8QAG2_9AGAM|nr:hypothetical protein AZE42_06091 [Rhizopogon vesiculosus]